MRNEVLVGDILDVAATLPSGSVQTIATSPPYWGLRSYSVPPTAWPAIEYAPMPGLPPVAVPAQTVCLGQEASPLAFIGHLVHVFRCLRPALREDGTLWLDLGDSYATSPAGKTAGDPYAATTLGGGLHNARAANGTAAARQLTYGLPQKNLVGIPWRAAFALQADGWTLRSEVIWHKVAPMPESVTDRPTKAHEQVFLFSKGPRYFYDAEAVRENVTGGTHAKGARGAPPKALSKAAAHEDARAGVENNASFVEATWELVSSRNIRTVWSPPPAQFPGAHFSTWPPELVRPMVRAGSSDHGACAACGSPYRRVTADAPAYAALKAERGRWGHDAGDGAVEFGRRQRGRKGAAMGSELAQLGARQHTTGWQPGCTCTDAGVRPCLILDPFMGSGTTAEVAVEEGRDWLGIDADPRAVTWTAERLAALPVGRLDDGQGATRERPAQLPLMAAGG